MANKRQRFRVPRLTSRASPVPVMWATKATVRALNTAQIDMPRRLGRAQELFLLEMAERFRAALAARNPTVPYHGEAFAYAQDLRIATLPGDAYAVAIYAADEATPLAEEDVPNMALYYRMVSGSPAWVAVLARYSPWPAGLAPLPVDRGHARIVARKVRKDEIDALTKQIIRHREIILSELRDAGARDAEIPAKLPPTGTIVHEDLAFAVARAELGLGDAPRRPEWIPALQVAVDAVPLVMRKVRRYLLTGRENIFDVPSDLDTISMQTLRSGAWFQRELAPFVPV